MPAWLACCRQRPCPGECAAEDPLAPGFQLPKQLDSIWRRGRDRLPAKLAEMSGGAFQLTVYASGEIVPPFNVMDAVSSGTVECGHTASYYWAKNEAFALSCAIPFGMTSRQLTA